MLNRIFFSFLSLTLFIYNTTYAQQSDTLIRHDYTTGKTDTLLPIPYNGTSASGNTAFFQGLAGPRAILATTPPGSNVFPGSSFSKLVSVNQFYNPSLYPVRTTVKINSYSNGTATHVCTGNMVSANMAITSAHCVGGFGTRQFFTADSFKVFPAWQNGQPNTTLGNSMIKRVYIFKPFYDGKKWEDIALLELKTPIGFSTGWIGMGYDTSIAAHNTKVLHKFSYPGTANPLFPNEVYNGDTLYYNYGLTKGFNSEYLGIDTTAYGIPGQSGSSLLYTDNQNEYYSVGVLSFSIRYRHYRFKAPVFYALKHILQANAIGINEHAVKSDLVSVSPNPFREELSVHAPEMRIKSIQLLNTNGELVSVHEVSDPETYFILNTAFLKPGLYIGRIIFHNGQSTHVKLIKE